MSQFIDETPRYNGQMSIQEVNYQWAVALLTAQHTIILELNASEADKDTPTLMGEDQRQIVERQIKQRSGQKTFRDQLLKSNPTCAVTGCKLVDILDAAHINVYRNDSHNHISNGLLLRSDIHTLYDLNLLCYKPDNKNHSFFSGSLGKWIFEIRRFKNKYPTQHSNKTTINKMAVIKISKLY